ncbi:MAG: hypothetical protein SGBAC_013396, partial [Bacillariaceae sp.]
MRQRLAINVRHWMPLITPKRYRKLKLGQNLAKFCSAVGNSETSSNSSPTPQLPLHSHKRAYSSSSFYFQSPGQQGEADVYREFRNNKSLSRPQWEDLEKEVIHTHARLDQELCQYTLRELLTNQQRSPPVAAPEVGPTGIWKYQSQQDPNRPERMIYTRHAEVLEQEPMDQVVLKLGPNDAALSMSLSVDESMIAYIVRGEDASSKIFIRHVEFGTELELLVDQKATGELVAVEFGPTLSPSSNGDSSEHSIYLLGSDVQGRPDRVLIATIGVNKEGFIATTDKEPTLLYRSDDPAVMVDVQRTKGCQYVSIRAMTKTSSEIFLTSGSAVVPNGKEANNGGFQSSNLIPVFPRTDHLQYHLDVSDQGNVFILVGAKHGEFQLLEATVEDLPLNPYELRKHETYTSDDNYVIDDIDLFQDYLVSYERSKTDGLQRIRVHDRQTTGPAITVSLPIPEESA